MIEVKSVELLKPNRKHVLLYMGQKNGESDFGLMERIDDCELEFLRSVTGRICYTVVPSYESDSESLKQHLKGCESVILLAATIGFEADRLIRRAAVNSPITELIFDSLGTEAVEQVCDRLCDDLSAKYGVLTSRFSPGYGDLKLSEQKKLIEYLDTNRMIGLTLTDSLLMTPTKSVTAIIGIKGNIK